MRAKKPFLRPLIYLKISDGLIIMLKKNIKYFIAIFIKSSFILKNFNSYKIYALRKVNDP